MGALSSQADPPQLPFPLPLACQEAADLVRAYLPVVPVTEAIKSEGETGRATTAAAAASSNLKYVVHYIIEGSCK